MQQIPRKIPMGQKSPIYYYRNLPALRPFLKNFRNGFFIEF